MADLYIHAINVHNGGGKNLLTALLRACPPDRTVMAALDSRLQLSDSVSPGVQICKVRPTLWGRLKAEFSIEKDGESHKTLLFFGNLPPLFRLRGYVIVYIHNRYLIDHVSLNGFSSKTQMRIWIERLWLSLTMWRANEFFVQTPSMKQLLENRLNGRVQVRVLPFMLDNGDYTRKALLTASTKEVAFDFLYVASGEPHKNHRQLIEAWCLLASDGLFPSLKLTVDKSQSNELHVWISQKIDRHRLNVENLGTLRQDGVKLLYAQTRALIYPSTFESFGLPLIEARQAGLPILASELDYVRDVLDPEQTFDPDSAVSIARAVKRFLGLEEKPLPLQDASGFINHILKRVE